MRTSTQILFSAASFGAVYLIGLVFVLVLALLMPIIPYYPVMCPPEESWSDLIPAIVLGLAGAILLVAIVRALIVGRKAGRDNDS